MESFDIYKDIAERTEGNIYIGMLGPVRTGKSTFVRRFMELLVLPNIENQHKRERAKDELPQSAAGRTIMTTEPKFVPSEAVEIAIKDVAKMKVRMVDGVGFLAKGALGHIENNAPRMVKTPWFDQPIPFEEAAEFGTRKVIEDATIGIMMTTDGSITELPRSSYIEAEEKSVNALKQVHKPFVIVLNTAKPGDQDTQKLRDALEEKYDTPVLVIDVLNMTVADIEAILEKLLFEFPLTEINIQMPKWLEALGEENWLISGMIDRLKQHLDDIDTVRDAQKISLLFADISDIKGIDLKDISLGQGRVLAELSPKEGLFYKILSDECGYEINEDYQLIGLMKELTHAKREYDRIAKALADVRERGYGIVEPTLEEMTLEEPQIVKQGGRFGVRLRAEAPSIHMILANIETEVSPIVGTERQSEELVNYMLKEFENDPAKIWETNIFGKSLHDLVKEGLDNKLQRMPEDTRMKLQETLQRIINEGSGSLICIIL
ncbi:stage IV sporulation protein A [Mahella sp.]|uniref:stage IV sporulation protein A n=1 Tax=Mahella sp. TaxID=2798721 RepID=UPI0025C324B2|nr:stage IV sporulation protein A [Mahella sp.]MBZ4666600.1 stage sporulation protein [Mahella sp.]